MEYTVGELAKLAGISTRALRHYDRIGLLKPARLSESGYRIYGPAEVDRLQQILIYRELGVDLERIREILDAPGFDALAALKAHHGELVARKRRLETLIANVAKSIKALEGEIEMTDAEKFEGLKRALVEENEKRFGKEVDEAFGEGTLERSNAKVLGMSREEYREAMRLATEVHETLMAAMDTGDPGGELAQKAADLHRRWLMYYWESYSKEAHAGLAQLYVDDERFRNYYDRERPGVAAFLRDAIHIYTGVKPGSSN